MSGHIKELMQVKDLDIKVSWNIMKNVEKLENVVKRYSTLEKELVEKYALKDDDGNIKLDDNNQPKFPPRTEFYKKQNELLECEETIDVNVIKLSDLNGSGLSPATLYNFKFMIDESE